MDAALRTWTRDVGRCIDGHMGECKRLRLLDCARATWQFATDAHATSLAQVSQGLTGDYRDILTTYWQQVIEQLENEAHDYKQQPLPLARIKKVMKADPEVKMISAEAPILFAKGCDIFITELTMRAWIHAEENKRRTLQRSDIASALAKSDMFDFLIDIVPREEAVSHSKRSAAQSAAAGASAGQHPQHHHQQQPHQHQAGSSSSSSVHHHPQQQSAQTPVAAALVTAAGAGVSQQQAQQQAHHMAAHAQQQQPPSDYLSSAHHGIGHEQDYRSQAPPPPGMYPPGNAVQSSAVAGPYGQPPHPGSQQASHQPLYSDMENMYGYASMGPQQVRRFPLSLFLPQMTCSFSPPTITTLAQPTVQFTISTFQADNVHHLA